MSGGGLMQLVAYGAQDLYLTGNPSVTFFKSLYKRHTNFAMQSVETVFSGTVGFNRRVTCIVPRVGDLMGKVYLKATMPSITAAAIDTNFSTTNQTSWTNSVGNFLMKNIEVQIGGQVIDKHYSTWLHIWSELSIPEGKKKMYDLLVQGPSYYSAGVAAGEVIPSIELWIPLQFWFCQSEGLALPLIALQYHEVRFVIEFEEYDNLFVSETGTVDTTGGASPQDLEASLYIDYIFLDSSERRKFASNSHEYLITQIQTSGDEFFKNLAYRKQIRTEQNLQWRLTLK